MTTATKEGTPANAILVYADEGGVHHRFCPSAEAHQYLDANSGKGGSAFLLDADETMSASLVYDVSPDLRRRIELAKDKLKDDLRIQAALDKHGVPVDRAIRSSIYAALKELRA